MNADSRFEGIEVFLENKENDWLTIYNRDGKKNLVTNRGDSKIKYLHLYKKL